MADGITRTCGKCGKRYTVTNALQTTPASYPTVAISCPHCHNDEGKLPTNPSGSTPQYKKLSG